METTRLYIVRAEYAGDVSLHIFFSDGMSQTVDFKPFILAHPRLILWCLSYLLVWGHGFG